VFAAGRIARVERARLLMCDAAPRITTVGGAVISVVEHNGRMGDASRARIAAIDGARIAVVYLRRLMARTADGIARIDRAGVAVVDRRRSTGSAASVLVADFDSVANIPVVTFGAGGRR